MRYDIVRFHKVGRKRLMFSGVTLEQAQEWCSNPLTHKEGKYFDGYGQTGEYCPNQAPYYAGNYFKPTNEYH